MPKTSVRLEQTKKHLKNINYSKTNGDARVQIWEAAMSASNYHLSNIIAILDYNRFQQDGKIDDVMNIEPIKAKWKSFNWEIKEADGHSFSSLSKAITNFKTKKPKLLIAKTVKGKGISFMENNNEWHVGGSKFTQKILNESLNELGE